jgi:Tol biopolymer transport system component
VACAAEPAPELAFLSDREGVLELFVTAVDTSFTWKVNSGAATEYGLDWSATGVFLFGTNRDGNNEVYTIRPERPTASNLTYHRAWDGEASWSPDGTQVAFVSDRAGYGRDVFIMNADGSEVRQLTRNQVYDAAPRFSPDGARIAFCQQVEPGNSEIVQMNTDGSEVTRLTERSGFDCAPDWSPDGTAIAFHGCTADGICQIHVMAAEGGEPRQLTDEHDNRWPRWSPDGLWIAFTTTRDDQTDVWAMRPDGTEQRPLTTHSGRDELTAWRPMTPN